MTQLSKLLVIDCQTSGVAGDMFLGSLIDLGANVDKIISAIKMLEKPAYGYGKVKIDIKKVVRGEFKGTNIDVASEKVTKTQRHEIVNIVEDILDKIVLSVNARQFASKVIRTLIDAEANLHDNGSDNGALDEIAMVDTAAEIIGTAVALEDLGLFDAKIYSTPVAVGGGVFKMSHGIVSSPAPATLAILRSKNFPFKGGPIEAELATPTGVSILVNLADEVNRFYPAITPLKIGYGAGTKDFPGLPNVLRLTLGQALDGGSVKDQIAVLETNIDDAPGEIIGYALDRLLAEGAKDVSIIPAFTKKNRPGQIIKVIADQKDAQHLSQVLIKETGTLGVRAYFCERHIIAREVLSVDLLIDGNKEPVKIKVSKSASGEIIRIKPEYEDLKRLAEKTDKPLRELFELAIDKARETLGSTK